MADRQHCNAARLFRDRVRGEQGPARGGGFQGFGIGRGGLFQGQLQLYRPPAGFLFEHRPETMKALQKQLKSLRDEPLEGFRLIIDENNLFQWTIAMFGPPDTPYAGGYFKAKLRFPMFFPDSPPEMIFTPPLYHPNIYPDGKVCLSFLHPPGDDPRSGEKADQRWKPDRDIRQILLAVIALLSQPNADSPANVDAAVNYRQYQKTGSKDYLNRIMRDVENSKAEAIKDNVVVPLTREDYQATGAGGAKKKEEEAQEEKEAETAAAKEKTSAKKKSSAKKKAPAKKKAQANNGTAPENPDSDDADEDDNDDDDNSEASTGDDDDDSDETYDPDTDEAHDSETDDAVD